MRKLRTFDLWLKKRGQTSEAFALEAGISYNTVVKWRNGVRPHNFARQALAPKFPDCPLFAD